MCDCNFICDCNYSKNINEKRVADYDFAIATLKKMLQEKQTVFEKKDIC
jgi:hypothetical protein